MLFMSVVFGIVWEGDGALIVTVDNVLIADVGVEKGYVITPFQKPVGSIWISAKTDL